MWVERMIIHYSSAQKEKTRSRVSAILCYSQRTLRLFLRIWLNSYVFSLFFAVGLAGDLDMTRVANED